MLVANEVVGRQKLQRLTALAHSAKVGVCADDLGLFVYGVEPRADA